MTRLVKSCEHMLTIWNPGRCSHLPFAWCHFSGSLCEVLRSKTWRNCSKDWTRWSTLEPKGRVVSVFLWFPFIFTFFLNPKLENHMWISDWFMNFEGQARGECSQMHAGLLLLGELETISYGASALPRCPGSLAQVKEKEDLTSDSTRIPSSYVITHLERSKMLPSSS